MKSRKLKLSLVFVLTLSIAILVMAGCTPSSSTPPKQDPTSSPGQTEGVDPDTAAKPPVIFTVSSILPVSWNDYPDSITAKFIKDKFGITFNVVDISENKDALMAVGNLPDCFIIESHEVMPLIESGFILPLDDLLAEYGPHIFPNEDIMNFQREALNDGKHIYGLTGYYVEALSPGLSTGTWGLNVDWERYAELGYPEINADVDEIYQLIVDMVELKTKTDDGLPVYAMDYPGSDMRMQSLYTCNVLGHYPLQSFASFNCATGEIINLYTDINGPLWEINRLYFKLNQAGLFDPDSLSGSFDGASLKASNGQYVAGLYHDILANANRLKANEGVAGGFQFIPLKGMSIWGGADFSYGNRNLRCFSKNIENPERLMEFLDFIYTPEGKRVVVSGEEGVTWNYVNGVPTLTEEVAQAYLAGGEEWNKYGLNKFNAGTDVKCADGYGTNLFNELEFLKRYQTPLQKSVENHYGMSMAERVAQLFEKGEVTDQSTVNMRVNNSISALPDDLNQVLNNIDVVMGEGIVECLLAPDEATYNTLRDNLIERIKEMGMDDVFNWYITNYNELAEKYK
jgi:putative aldouronate transport system substrate-binding protein